jgi:hypothetical protein
MGPFLLPIPHNTQRYAEFCLYIGRNLLCQGKYPGELASHCPGFLPSSPAVLLGSASHH